MLKQALEMSMQPESVSETPSADFAMMSEDEQIAYAMRMSMQTEGKMAFCFFRNSALLEQMFQNNWFQGLITPWKM